MRNAGCISHTSASCKQVAGCLLLFAVQHSHGLATKQRTAKLKAMQEKQTLRTQIQAGQHVFILARSRRAYGHVQVCKVKAGAVEGAPLEIRPRGIACTIEHYIAGCRSQNMQMQEYFASCVYRTSKHESQNAMKLFIYCRSCPPLPLLPCQILKAFHKLSCAAD